MRIHFLKYMSSHSWTFFFSSPWWVRWMGGIACMCSMTCMLLDPLHTINNIVHHVCSMSSSKMDPWFVLPQFHPWVHFVPIFFHVPTTIHWNIYATSCSSWVASLSHATPSLFHLLPLHDLHVMSSLHNLSLQIFFHYQWICLILQLFFASMVSTTFLLHSLHSLCCLQLLFMLLLTMMFFLDVLVHEQIDVFMSR